MTSHQQARLLQASDREARHEWPTLTPNEAQEAKDVAWTLFVTLYRIEGGDPAIHRANYMNQVAMIEKAAGWAQ
ncbi:hypothetical protein [Novosphingobium sp. KN65.2]|uniref:hypothetical protein n=1 Tax=Novosphingobium sp. KN65.2 TaxID=1478134 RepID=UPI0005DCEDA8|nr:hypothetical protein [Novosphingobium sp. KN65.2]CDO38953.1 hypothetical protein SPHV1_880006 [Novosphingobium sp. KN65.2]